MTPRIERLRLYDAVYAESTAQPGFYITIAAYDDMQARALFDEFLAEHGVHEPKPSRITVQRRENETRPVYSYV